MQDPKTELTLTVMSHAVLLPVSAPQTATSDRGAQASCIWLEKLQLVKQLSRYINYKGCLRTCSHPVSSPCGFHLHFLPLFFITNWHRAASVTRTVRFSHVRESEGPALYTCAILSLHWATTSRREDACVLTWSSRSGGKKRYVPSDVIKAKIYLFSLCIHGEIVSTGSKLMYYCTNIRGVGRLRPFPSFLNGTSLSCCIQRALNRSRQCLFGGCPGRWSSTVFMVALPIDAMCELLTCWFIPLNRPGNL